jgi:PTS system beta-glucosides-specific IIC component
LVAGGLVGGLICGLFDVYVTAFAFSGVLGAPAFLASPRAVPYFAAVFATIAVSFVLTLLLDRRGRARQDAAAAEAVATPAAEPVPAR